MMKQISNTKFGYIVSVWLSDDAGHSSWQPVINFGVRLGDAIDFCDHIIEKLCESTIRKMINHFNKNKTFNLCFDDKGNPLYQMEINFNEEEKGEIQ